MKVAAPRDPLPDPFEEAIIRRISGNEFLPVACRAGQMRQAFLLGLGPLGIVSRIAIGDQGAGEVDPQQIARHFSRAGGVELKVDVLVRGVHPVIGPLAVEDPIGFIRMHGAVAGGDLLADVVDHRLGDIRKKIAASDGAVHADETYWTLDGGRAYYWAHATDRYIHFQFDTSRAGEVSREVLGADFAGTLVTDCYSAYDAQGAEAKQKCLAHLARTARDWQKLTSSDSPEYRFFDAVEEFLRLQAKKGPSIGR